jgi:uncharacterized protein (TIGR00288 family)
MKRMGVFIDVSNFYYCVSKRFSGRRLSYEKYYEFIVDMGKLVVARAYGAQQKDEAAEFILRLQGIGFETCYKKVKTYKDKGKTRKKADWDVGMTMDIVRMVNNEELDLIILGTADSDLEPLVAWCKEKGVETIVLACGISRELKNTASHAIEIFESLVEPKGFRR